MAFKVANKVYVSNFSGNSVTMIDATTNAATNIVVGNTPREIAVNQITGKVYNANQGTNSIAAITPAPTNAMPLNTTTVPQNGNTTSFSDPTFAMTATSTYSPNASPPQSIYYQMDTTNGTWSRATFVSSTATTVTATAAPTGVSVGVHIIYFFATDGSDATSTNPSFAEQLAGKEKGSMRPLSPESSAVTGGINAYLFRRIVGPTAANVSVNGRVLTDSGLGVRNALVVLTDSEGTSRSVLTSSLGYYQFGDVPTGANYIISVVSKRYQFATRIVNVSDDVTNFDLFAEPAFFRMQ